MIILKNSVMYPNNPNPSNETFSNPLLKVNEFYRYVYFSNYTTRIILTILSRIGYVLLQISSVSKQDNLNLILFKNIKDICCTTIAYFTIGFLVIFDADVYSFIYGDYYSFENFLIKKEEFLIGWQVVIMTSAIYMISMTENICFIAHFLVNLLLAGLVQPFLIRWSLMPEGWIVKGKLYDVRVYFRDHAGSGIVHVVGGLSGLIIYLILSRKNYIFKAKNIDRINLPSFLLSTTCLGLFLIFVGLLNLSLSTSENDTSNTINTVINNLIAACCCSLCFMILHLTFKRSIDHWTTLRCVQGLIVGLIMISSASNKYSHLMSIGLGYLGGVIFYLISRLIFYRDLDHCNIIAIHLICGFFANVLAPFCVSEQNASTQFRLLNLSWQLISLIVLMGLVTVTLTPLLLILQVFGFLKHRSQIFKVNESTISLEMTKRFSDKNITCDKYEESIINNTNLLSIKFTGENSYQPQNELLRLEEDEFIKENYLNKIATMKNEELSDPSQSSGRKVHKLRQIYTLSGYNLISSQDQFANGDRIDIDLTNSRKYFSETNLQHSPNISHHSKEIQRKLNLSCYVDIKENNDNEITIKNEYQLRRTQKFMNLREELDKQEFNELEQKKEFYTELILT